MRRLTMIAAVLALCLFTPSSSRAGDYYNNLRSGLPYHGFGYSGSLYGLGYIPVPPYYALHPPVYYSHQIIRRPYGDSPFAYRPQRPAPRPAPRLVLNPFVPETQATSLDQVDKTAATSKMIRNPYYKPEVELATAEQ
jgi:hypothetical protein